MARRIGRAKSEYHTLDRTVRMKRPGAQWKHTTGDEVLQLRALQLSDRWAPAVQQIAALEAEAAANPASPARPPTSPASASTRRYRRRAH